MRRIAVFYHDERRVSACGVKKARAAETARVWLAGRKGLDGFEELGGSLAEVLCVTFDVPELARVQLHRFAELKFGRVDGLIAQCAALHGNFTCLS